MSIKNHKWSNHGVLSVDTAGISKLKGKIYIQFMYLQQNFTLKKADVVALAKHFKLNIEDLG